jgi:hypothetical protein
MLATESFNDSGYKLDIQNANKSVHVFDVGRLYEIEIIDSRLNTEAAPEVVVSRFHIVGLHLLKILSNKFIKAEDIEPQLKEVYSALSRAVEEGDQLKIGIVLGQTLTKLEQIINGN